MTPFSSLKHADLLKTLPFSYFASTAYHDDGSLVEERNGETLLLWKDVIPGQAHSQIWLPANPANWESTSFACATEEDLARLRAAGVEIVSAVPDTVEYFYRTEQFLEPKGSFAKMIRQCRNKHDVKLLRAYDKAAVLDLYRRWADQRPRPDGTVPVGLAFLDFCLTHAERYGMRCLFAEVEGKLAGFAIGEPLGDDGWIALHLKVDYAYTGLSRLLIHERAKLFADRPRLSSGTDAGEEGISSFKHRLNPERERRYFNVVTGAKRA